MELYADREYPQEPADHGAGAAAGEHRDNGGGAVEIRSISPKKSSKAVI